MNDYGKCECGCDLVVGEYGIEEEFNPKSNTPTGRVRSIVGYLICPMCLKKFVVDDSFDGNWYYKWERNGNGKN